MSRLDQDDFSALAVCSATDSTVAHREQLCGEMMEEQYVPRNVLKPEVYALLQSWQANDKRILGLCEAEMKAAPAAVSIDFDPTRLMHTACPAPPPKRFYRRFWKSISRRVLENDKTAGQQ
jgi:hypothetical protein